MVRVLFVDDDQQVLDGLRDVLRKQRTHWDMVFALGADNALAELASSAFDVILTDMRMPGMDGVSLLQIVKDRYPATARIILSGHAERDAVVNALPVAHQFLSKPCNVDLLRTVVSRACSVQSLLQDENIRRVIGRLDRLPSVPQTYWKLTQAAAQPDVGLSDLAKIVETDPAMSVKVLQLVNSSYFGLAAKQTSLQQAVMYLGAELLKALALTAHVFASGSTPTVKGFSVESLQEHSLVTAQIASSFFSDKHQVAEAFTASIVHDIGKIVFAIGMPARFADVISECKDSGRADHIVEKELLGATHAEVGAYLLNLWGLPLSIVEAVACHHEPHLGAPTDILIALHVATALSTVTPTAEHASCDCGTLDVAFVESTHLGYELPRWRELAEQQRRDVEVGR